MTFLQQLIDQFGLIAALLAFAGINYVLIARRTKTAEAQAEASVAAAREANVRQQNAITEQFTAVTSDNRRLQSQIDSLNIAQDAADSDRMRLSSELADARRHSAAQEKIMRQSHEKVLLLEGQLNTLAAQVAALEAEKAQQTAELDRERRTSEQLTKSLAAASEQIGELKDRVSRLEGENAALRLMLERIRIVHVEPDPDPPEPPPPVALRINPPDKPRKEGAA